MMMKRHGYDADVEEIDARYQVAYKQQKTTNKMRYIGDGKEFWRAVVMKSIGCEDQEVFEDIYGFYELPAAWKVQPCPTIRFFDCKGHTILKLAILTPCLPLQVSSGAFPAVQRLRKGGIKTAIISDFDTRLRELVQSYGLDRAFDQIICSAEVGAEKPDPKIFLEACNRLGVEPHQVCFGNVISRALCMKAGHNMQAKPHLRLHRRCCTSETRSVATSLEQSNSASTHCSGAGMSSHLVK